MREFRLIALTPPGLADPTIAIAASRSGAIGVLDLQYNCDVGESIAAIARLGRFARQDCGIKIDGAATAFLLEVTSRLPSQVQLIILTPAEGDSLHRQVQACRKLNLTVLLETTCVEEAKLGEELSVDGLIAKGHEAAGRVGEETTFILLQRLLGCMSLPIWAHGGIGLHSVAACYVAGAEGVVLDAQLALTRESTLPTQVKEIITSLDGSETICLGANLGEMYRVYSRPGLTGVEELRRTAARLMGESISEPQKLVAWRQVIKSRVGWQDPKKDIWLLGQDAAFAASLTKRFRTVGGVLEGMRDAVETHVKNAQRLRPLDKDSPLARSHGTRYPVIQGPMTRVSDRAAFATRVAEGGGLPFLALALMRASEVAALLEETRQTLGEQPWGVGILGFVPLALRQEQLEVVRAYRPSFALIAGGRPDQALALESAGIPTYLHVPSPGLLRLFVENGARRFVFEGRECGGHVGPRSSFVLWNTMIDTLLESLSPSEMPACHVLFAGGIHDAMSGAMVATMAAPLAEQGVRIGLLMGTAYLFTTEAVATGAIQEGFQREAVQCNETVLLETGPGHATRCSKSPFVDLFQAEKQRLLVSGRSPEDIRESLEHLNLGRLRIASKGITRHPMYEQSRPAQKYLELSQEEQLEQGMYMIGQVAALRNSTCTIEELHREVSVKATELLASSTGSALELSRSPRIERRPCDVAIIGMACLLPKASDLQIYWENILNKVDAITEVPAERWNWQDYFNADPKTRDKIYSKWGGFVDSIPFDPMRYGMPPNTLTSIEPLQLLTLEVVRAALENAGYTDRPFPREHTSVILGAGGGISDLGQQYALRSGLPMFFETVPPEVLSRLPEWTEDSFAGILLNVAAGRVANRFDLGGVNYTVDAACASSLAAVYLATRELENGTSDMVIVGGADTVQNPFGYLCFSKTNALSARGRCSTFDESADGIVISEGVAVLVLKRLADAERDGDRIYAVIKSVAGSSDGRDKGLTAPRPEGQALALRRAYAKAGFSPSTVGLIEAHGTGTVAGDRAEIETLKLVFEAAGASRQQCAIGSVKSNIGHTKCTAGTAGLLKVALALYHKVLPPTINVEKPNPKARFAESPFYVNTELRPWIHGTTEHPRRAGVSAFGFGGTNFHVVVEEYTDDFATSGSESVSQNWPSELLVWTGDSREELLQTTERIDQIISRGDKVPLRDLAYTSWQLAGRDKKFKLAIVVTDLEDLRSKLASAKKALTTDGQVEISDPRGIYFTEQPLAPPGKIAFLFSGQGSQSVGMLREVALHFPEVREQFELADRLLTGCFPEPLSSYVYPPPTFSAEEQRSRQQNLTQTNIAQPALAAAGLGLFHLFRVLEVQPDLVAGHSFVEYIALCSGGVFSGETLYKLAEARGRCIIEAARDDLGTMAAVMADGEHTENILKSLAGVWIANRNAPQQTVISGTHQGIEQAIELLRKQGIDVRPIPVACAFHSPLLGPARDRLAEILSGVECHAPQLDVYSNSSAAPYPRDAKQIVALLADHLISPVRFADEIEAMYGAGARIFVELGSNNVLTGLTKQIIGKRPHLAVGADGPGRSGLVHLQHTLGQLLCQGVSVNLDRLYSGRAARRIELNSNNESAKQLPATTWLVNGGRARPLSEAAPGESSVVTAPVKETFQTAFDEKKLPAPGVVSATTPPLTLATPGNRAGSTSPLATTTRPAVPLEKPANSVDLIPAPAANRVEGPAGNAGDAGSVVLQFQRLMKQFLETQSQVMMAYLQQPTDATSTSLHVPLNASYTNPLAPIAASEKTAEQAAALASEATIPARESLSSNGSHPVSDARPSVAAEIIANEEPKLVDKQELIGKLLQVVSERTGYPPEMLDLDLNIEADLGIDSIKRVEILGVFQRMCLPPNQQVAHDSIELLTGIKTLRGIADSMCNILNAESTSKSDQLPVKQENERRTELSTTKANGGIQQSRFLLDAVAVPLTGPTLSILRDKLFLITDDEGGVADSLAAKLRNQGAKVAIVKTNLENGNALDDSYAADLFDPTAVAQLLEIVSNRQGRPAGIVHLAPLKTAANVVHENFASFRDSDALHVKSLFNLARAAGRDLRQGNKPGESWIIAATSMGGTFAADGKMPHGYSPCDAGIAGLIKTLALEWPGVRHKVVDLGAGESPAELAAHILAEITAPDETVEIGYRGSSRVVLQPRPAPLDPDVPARLVLDSNCIILLTGGARGITAEVACELADRYKPTLLLVGRSPFPQSSESTETAGLNSLKELKAALMSQMSRDGEIVTPARVEAAYSALLRDRAIRNNLATMEQSGASVSYFQCDVRDEIAFANLIDELYQTYGRIDGVVHGAGIIDDKLVDDKTPESFDRVFDTKINSAYVLAERLRPDSLKFLAFFSSVSGRFGNRGQADYAAANEVLNRLATRLDRTWPGRVVALNWGPWGGSGMVSESVAKQFEERGVELIRAAAGRRMFDDELRYGAKGEVEVILGRGPWAREKPTAASGNAEVPIVSKLEIGTRGAVEFAHKLDVKRDLYLEDHRLDGRPVLPAAMAAELMAEIALKGWPEWEVIGLRGFQLLKGIIVTNGTKSIRLIATPQTQLVEEADELQIDVEIHEENAKIPAYKGTVILSSRFPEPPNYDLLKKQDLRNFPMDVTGAYRNLLFHGPRFHCITEFHGIGASGLVVSVRTSEPTLCLAQPLSQSWVLDPIVLDAGPQLAILWASEIRNMTALPSRFTNLRRFTKLNGAGSLKCYFQVNSPSQDHSIVANVYFADQDDRVVLAVEGLESTCSAALNRLAKSGSVH